jgi:Ni/Fe-hydrogenase subunit HybB-like protein
MTRAGWSVTIRRIPEAFWPVMLPLGIFGVLFVVGGGVDHVFEWPHEQYHDELVTHKLPYLDTTRMLISTVLAFVIWGGFGFLFSKNSQKQDETGDPKLNKRNGVLAPIFAILMSLALTTFSVDFVMTLHPHWFSTMWAVNFWTTSFQSGLAVMVLVATIFLDRGIARNFITPDHVHDLAKLLFASTAFWAYIAFCQFLLMWYANLPEEAIFWNARMDWNHPGEHPWTAYTVALPILKFVIPFFLMLPRNIKRAKYPLLKILSVWTLIMVAFEVWWWVAPAPVPHLGEAHGSSGGEHGAHYVAPVLPWLEALTTIGFGGLFALTFGWAIQKANIVPIKDPRLGEALHHHQ